MKTSNLTQFYLFYPATLKYTNLVTMKLMQQHHYWLSSTQMYPLLIV